jgi:hypothetical protein
VDRIVAADWQAREYRPRSDDHFRAITFQANQWNGGYRTADFVTRTAWSAAAGSASTPTPKPPTPADDGFGDRYKSSDKRPHRQRPGSARRCAARASAGPRPSAKGSHPRLFDVVRGARAPADYLGGGFLVAAGTRLPLELAEPTGVLVVHQTRVDAQGRIAMARLGVDLRPVWSVTLPYTELRNRWQLSDRLVLFGSHPDPQADDSCTRRRWPCSGCRTASCGPGTSRSADRCRRRRSSLRPRRIQARQPRHCLL